MAKHSGFGGGNMQSMIRQAQKMQEQMTKAQAELAETEVVASAGGGLVEVTMTGAKKIIGITIKPEAVDPDDVEMLEDLIIAAINDASAQVEELSAEIMGPYASLLG